MIGDVLSAAGDRALLERVLRETRADTTPPTASGRDYLAALAEAFARWVARELGVLGPLLHVPASVLYAVAWTLLAVVAAVLAVAATRLVTRLVTRRGARVVPAAAPPGEALTGPPLATDAWAQELERRLQGADPRAALQALWWWLARRLKGAAAEPSWTTRELLLTAGRTDLQAEGRVLDRLLYAAGTPSMADIRGLALRLRRELP